MHVIEHCITDLKSLKAVVLALKLKEISVPIDVYKRIRCEDMGFENGNDRQWALTGYNTLINSHCVEIKLRR